MKNYEIFYGLQDDFILFSSHLQELAYHKNKKFLLRTLIHEYAIKLGEEIAKNSNEDKHDYFIKNAKIFYSCSSYTPYIRELAKAYLFLINLKEETDFNKVYKDFINHCRESGYCPCCGSKLVRDGYCEWCRVSYSQNGSQKERD